MNNPLLKEFKNEYGIPPFELIKEEHYICLLYTSDAADD